MLESKLMPGLIRLTEYNHNNTDIKNPVVKLYAKFFVGY